MKLKVFHGKATEDYHTWRVRLRACLRAKKLWDHCDPSKQASPSSSDLGNKLEEATDIIYRALADAPLRVVISADGKPRMMLKLLDERFASCRATNRMALLETLYHKKYDDTQNMPTFVDEFTSLFAQLESMGEDVKLPESHKAPLLLASIPDSSFLSSTAAALRTQELKTFEATATILIDEYQARAPKILFNTHKNRRGKGPRQGRKSFVDHDSHYESRLENLDNHNLGLLASLLSQHNKSSNMSPCDFRGKIGHKKERCFYNPENPDNRLPPKVAERMLLAHSKNGVLPNVVPPTSKRTQNTKKLEVVGVARIQHKTTVNPPNNLHSYYDSGATTHLFHNLDAFVPGSLRQARPHTITLANGAVASGTHEGDVIIPFDHVNLRLTSCIYAPDMGYNLISVGCMADKGIRTTFTRDRAILELFDEATNSTIHIGDGVRDPITRLYKADQIQISRETAMITTKNQQSMLWHRRLAHLNFRDLASTHKVAEDIPPLHTSNKVCRACRLGKAHKLPFRGKFERAERVGQIVHSDIVGPLEPSYTDGWRYMCTFIDDYSRFVVVAFMRHKDELYDAYRQYLAYLNTITSDTRVELVNVREQSASLYEKHCGHEVRIGRIHSDYGLEYVSLGQQHPDTVKTFSPPYTPELNGIAERINRTIVEPARSMLCQAGLPECFWPYAVGQAVFVRNRVRHSTINSSPYYLITGKKPSLKYMRVFGCAAYVLRLPRTGGKFAPRADEGTLLGSDEHGIYTILVESESELPRIIKSRHVTFDEDRFLGSDLAMDSDDGASS